MAVSFGVLIFLGKRKDDQGVATRSADQIRSKALEPTAPTRWHSDVLLAIDAVSDRTAMDAASGAVSPQ
jgi:hypothetical protein